LNYYPFHIGDYVSDTRHLSWDEDAAYRRLLDAYYVKEGPLPLELRQVFRLVIASTPEQREAVETVLREFFEETPEGWRHSRCDNELAAMKLKREKAAQSAHAKWAKARAQDSDANAEKPDANAGSAASEGTATNTNTNTNTNTKGKRQKTQAAPALSVSDLLADGVDEALAAEFLAHREALKAPLTARAWSDHKAECLKAGWSFSAAAEKVIAKGWRGFEARYVAEQRGPPRQQTVEERNRAVIEEMFKGAI